MLEGSPEQDGLAEEQFQQPSVGLTNQGYAKANIPIDISRKILQDLKPFSPPPVPEVSTIRSTSTRRKVATSRTPAKSRQWKTTIVLTEYTTPSGQKSYSASGTPLEQVPRSRSRPRPLSIPTVAIEEPATTSIEQAPLQQPFLDRMRQRGMNIRQSRIPAPMMAISVKRQRKLKMKKKKYKKLMKKTRNLRRKLGKI